MHCRPKIDIYENEYVKTTINKNELTEEKPKRRQDTSVRMEWHCSTMPMNKIDHYKFCCCLYLRIRQQLWAYTFEIDRDKLDRQIDSSLDLKRKTFVDIHQQLNWHLTRNTKHIAFYQKMNITYIKCTFGK